MREIKKNVKAEEPTTKKIKVPGRDEPLKQNVK
jgi:hypothetical protein